MKPIRSNIAGLMALVALVAAGIIILDRPTIILADTVFSLAIASNYASVVVAIAGRDRTRSIALGFAVCSVGYLVHSSGHLSGYLDRDQMVTTHLIHWVFGETSISPPCLDKLGHATFGIIAGLAGGLLAWSLTQATDDPARSNTNTTGHL